MYRHNELISIVFSRVGLMKKLLITLISLSLLLFCGCSTHDASNPLQFGSYEDSTYLVQISINPTVAIGYTEDGEVVHVTSLDEDGYKLLKKRDSEALLGTSLDAAIGFILSAAYEDGYQEALLDVELRSIGDNEADAEALQQAAQAAIDTCEFDVNLRLSEGEEIQHRVTGGYYEEHACSVCKGKGSVSCATCKGSGEAVSVVMHEKEVRNDYVCEVCGGKGWIDDGLHGGEIANCDSCGGRDGKMPSSDFRAKAYDKVMVEEEFKNPCKDCGSTGEITCAECDGSGLDR